MAGRIDYMKTVFFNHTEIKTLADSPVGLSADTASHEAGSPFVISENTADFQNSNGAQ